MKKNTKFHIFKLVVTGIALLNLIALFVFNYKLPFTDNKSDVPANKVDVTETSDYSISFDTDKLIYDGSSELDLMNGVKVIGPEGTVTDMEVFANIITADTLSEKEIVYTIDTEDGQVSANRKLILNNYSGPSLKLPATMPETTEEGLETYITLMPTDGTFVATDGFGNDITAQVTSSYKIDPANPTIVHLVFTVSNMFNDKVSIPVDITIESDRPVLILKQTSVTVSKGSAFLPHDYIERAETQQGADLLHTVEVEGSVDTNTPGKYVLKYTATNNNGISSIPQQLEVVVE